MLLWTALHQTILCSVEVDKTSNTTIDCVSMCGIYIILLRGISCTECLILHYFMSKEERCQVTWADFVSLMVLEILYQAFYYVYFILFQMIFYNNVTFEYKCICLFLQSLKATSASLKTTLNKSISDIKTEVSQIIFYIYLKNNIQHTRLFLCDHTHFVVVLWCVFVVRLKTHSLPYNSNFSR